MSLLLDRAVVLGTLCCIFLLTSEVQCSRFYWPKTPENLPVSVSKDSIRLVDDSKNCTGFLQVKPADSESWQFVCASLFSDLNALVSCRDLNCGFTTGHIGTRMTLNKNQSFSLDLYNCSGTERHLSDCPTSALDSDRDCRPTVLGCSQELGLPDWSVFSPHGPGKGQVYKGHSYTIVCSLDYPFKVRSFVLGVGDYEWSQPAVDNQASFVVPIKDENFPFSCKYNFELEPQIFSPKRYGFVEFKEPSYVRLEGGVSRCLGVLTLLRGGGWRAVSQRNWGLKEGAVVCRQLNCGSAISSESRRTEPRSVWKFFSDCDGSETALLGCGSIQEGHSDSTVSILCSDILHPPKIRVSSLKSSLTQDSTLVYTPNSFNVTCSAPFQFPGGHFSLVFTGVQQSLTLNQVVDDFSAVFTFALSEKSHSGKYSCVYHNVVLGHNVSSQSQNITVTVEDTVKLVGAEGEGFSGRVCSGTLLVADKSQKMMVTAETLQWDMKRSGIVCRQLGCGSARSTSVLQVPRLGPMWRFFSDCDGSESALLQCGHVEKVFSSKAITVVCQG